MMRPFQARFGHLAARAVILMLCMLIFSGCAPKERQIDGFAMNTFYTLAASGRGAKDALKQAEQGVRHVEALFSATRADSDVGRINAAAGRSVTVESETVRVLQRVAEFSKESGYAFNPLLGPLKELWDIGGANRIPAEAELAQTLARCDPLGLTVDARGSAAMVQPGQAMDLGGAAKGYAGDVARQALLDAGIKSALLNLGGNIVTLGGSPDGGPWRIGVANPRGEGFIAVLEVTGKCVVTSGDYIQYFTKDGVRYHHIFDPKTGYPADGGACSVTVLAGESLLADLLSTALFVMGPKRGIEFIEDYPGVEALFLTEAKEAIMSVGMREYLVALNEDWTLK